MQGNWLRKSVSGNTVVFIHGVLSSSDAWRHPTGAYWPAILHDERDLENYGIYVFEYGTGLFSGTYSLSDVVDSLKEFFILDDVIDSSGIVFICHSMGGIVARRYIVQRASELIASSKKIGLYLVASPSLGSAYANWLGPLARAFEHTQADVLRFEQTNVWLNDLDHDFINLKESKKLNIIGKEIVEDKFSILRKWWRKQVVEPFSGARYFGEPYKVPNSDHFSIAKIENSLAVQHRLLVKFLKEFAPVGLPTEKISKTKHITATTSRLDETYSGALEQARVDYVSDAPRVMRAVLPRLKLINSALEILAPLVDAGTAQSVTLIGSGGSGKTTLATMIADNTRIRTRYPDGVFWVTVGQSPDIAALHVNWTMSLPDRPITFLNIDASTAFLRSYFKSRSALLIIDDVWDVTDLSYFAVVGASCRSLITTREMKIATAADTVLLKIDALSLAESKELLSISSGKELENDLNANSLAVKLEGLPLALVLASYQLKTGISTIELNSALEAEVTALNLLDVPGFEHEKRSEIAKNLSLNACMNLSIRRLGSNDAQRLALLSSLERGQSFTATTAKYLWGDFDYQDPKNTLRTFWSMSLLERVDETNTSHPTCYRMHSLVRSRCKSMLVAAGGGEHMIAAALTAMLRNINGEYPAHWDKLDLQDNHLSENIVQYICNSGNPEPLQHILTSRVNDSSTYSPNAWRTYRDAHSRPEEFALDIQKIRARGSSKVRDILEFDILTRGALTWISLLNMNKEIDASLCVALADARLWSDGLAAAHARRRFRPQEMLSVSHALAEPLRTQLVLSAFTAACINQSKIELASDLVECAVLVRGEAATDVIKKATAVVYFHLSGIKSWDRWENISYYSLEVMRAAIFMETNHAPSLSLEPLIARSVDTFLRSLYKWTSDNIRPLQAAQKDEHIKFVLMIETALHLAQVGPLRFRDVASKALIYINSQIANTDEYGIISAKICLQLNILSHQALKSMLVDMICRKSVYDIVGEASIKLRLSPSEGLEGLVRLIIDAYKDDSDFFDRVWQEKPLSRVALSLIEPYFVLWLNRSTPLEGDWLRTKWLRELLRGLEDRGSFLPQGSDRVSLQRGFGQVVSHLVSLGLAEGRITNATLAMDLLRIRDDVDRVSLLEAILPCLPALTIDTAERIWVSFSHRESEGLACLILGAKVPAEAQLSYLKKATTAFVAAEATVPALRGLSAYGRYYDGEHAHEIARAAVSFASGIGDAGRLKAFYAIASLDLPLSDRMANLRAPFWFSPDTMPVHGSISPLQRSQSLICKPFWKHDDASELDKKRFHDVSDHDFLEGVCAYLSDLVLDEERSIVYKKLSDIACELSLRNIKSHSSVISRAMYDTALMYP